VTYLNNGSQPINLSSVTRNLHLIRGGQLRTAAAISACVMTTVPSRGERSEASGGNSVKLAQLPPLIRAGYSASKVNQRSRTVVLRRNC
jgi:hypothetical protein